MRQVHRFGWSEEEVDAAQEAHVGACGGRALVGLAAVVLGIIAIVFSVTIPAVSLVLSLVALLCLGSGALLSGSAMSTQVISSHHSTMMDH